MDSLAETPAARCGSHADGRPGANRLLNASAQAQKQPQMQPMHPVPRRPDSPRPPKVTLRGHTCRAPAVAPASSQGQRGTRPGAGIAAAPCFHSANPGRPPVSSSGRQSAMEPQRARGASRALVVLAWTLPKSPHPLDISANQSTWRSARRQPPAVQSALQVPPLHQDSASESRTFLSLLAEDAANWSG